MSEPSIIMVEALQVPSGSTDEASERHLRPNPPREAFVVDEETASTHEIAELSEDEIAEGKRKNGFYFRNRMIYVVLQAIVFSLGGSWLAVKWSFDVLPKVLGPSPEVFDKAWDDARYGPSRMGKAWAQCFRDEGERCHQENKLTYDIEDARLASIHAANTRKLQHAHNITAECRSAYAHAAGIVERRALNGTTIPWKNSCPTEKRDEILGAAGKLRQSQDEIVQIIASIENEAVNLLRINAQYAKDQVDYHTFYIADNFEKIPNFQTKFLNGMNIYISATVENVRFLRWNAIRQINAVIACISPVEGHSCRLANLPDILSGYRDRLDDYFDYVLEWVNRARNGILHLIGKWNWAKDSLLFFVDLVNKVAKNWGFIYSVFARNNGLEIDLTQFIGLPNYSLNSFDVSTFSRYYAGNYGLQDVLDGIRDGVNGVLASWSGLGDSVIDQVKKGGEDLIKDAMELFEDFGKNYNPPDYPIGFDEESFWLIAEKFIAETSEKNAQVKRVLEDLKTVREEVPEVDAEEFVNEEIDLEEVESYTEEATNLLSLQLPEVPEWVKRVFEWLRERFLIVDALVRVWGQFVFKLLRFYDASAVPTPLIVLGEPGEDASEVANRERAKKKPLAMKAWNAVYDQPWPKVAAAVLVCSLLGGTGLYAYKYYGHYDARCVQSTTATFEVQGIIRPSLQNPEYLRGKAAKDIQRARLYNQRTRMCRDLKISSGVSHRQQEESLFDSSREYNATMVAAEPFRECLDLRELSGGEHLPDVFALCSLPSVIENFSIENGIVNCSELKRCEMVCDDESKFNADTEKILYENSCIVQWHYLSEMIIFCLQLLQYLCFYLSSKCTQGAVFIFLRAYLRPDSVKWVYEQDIKTGLIIGTEGLTLEQAKAEARAAHRSRELAYGWFLVSCAVALQFCWVVPRFILAVSDDFLEPRISVVQDL